jgi:acyl-CoA thioester hydrolase
LTVRHYECDPLGHVNHAVYVHYFEVGRLEAMTAAGLPFSELLKQGYAIVAVDIYVQYKAPAFADDVLDLQSWIASFRSAVMLWHQTLSRHTTGELLALAEVTGAFTRADGRPTRIPSHIRALFDAIHVPEVTWPDLRRGRFASS